MLSSDALLKVIAATHTQLSDPQAAQSRDDVPVEDATVLLQRGIGLALAGQTREPGLGDLRDLSVGGELVGGVGVDPVPHGDLQAVLRRRLGPSGPLYRAGAPVPVPDLGARTPGVPARSALEPDVPVGAGGQGRSGHTDLHGCSMRFPHYIPMIHSTLEPATMIPHCCARHVYAGQKTFGDTWLH